MKYFNAVDNLLVVAGTNAVPPSGVMSIGALAIGNIKSKTEIGLFKLLQESEAAALIDFPQAYDYAQSVVKKLFT